MKKTATFKQLSSKKCKTPGCDRWIKQAVIDRRPTAEYCYRCFCNQEARRGHHIITGRAARVARGGNIDRPTTEEIRANRNIRSIQE